MLEKLYIKDYAIVDELTIDFSPGFQVITGETGAGKSILVGAISLLCGERSTSDLIRANKKKAIVEGEFSNACSSTIIRLLTRWGISTAEDILVLRRELNIKGPSRAFINDTPVSLTSLSELSTHLLDLHGQHQHQQLLYSDNHITYLDAYGGLTSIIKKYLEKYQIYQNKCRDIDHFKTVQKEIHEKEDLIRFQLQELERYNLQENELEQIKSEIKILENSELLFELTKDVSEKLYDASESALNLLTQALIHVNKLSTIA